jgi:hypothetical protein
MSSDRTKLKEQLRTYYGDDLPCRELLMDARHAIEALEGEIARLNKLVGDQAVNCRVLAEKCSRAATHEARAERLRVALDKAGKFIADQFATDEDEDNGEWLAKDAREIYATLCKALEDDNQ